MFLYEKDRDKVLVYDFSPKEEEIKEYKKDKIDTIPKSKLFYLFTKKIYNDLEKRWFYVYDKNLYMKPYIEGQIHSRSNYWPNNDKEKNILNSYFNDFGMLLVDGNESFFLAKDNTDYYSSEIIKLPARLANLWYLEHNELNITYYKELLDLFNFSIIKKFDQKTIDELIQYGLISELSIDYSSQKIKTLKRMYKNR